MQASAATKLAAWNMMKPAPARSHAQVCRMFFLLAQPCALVTGFQCACLWRVAVLACEGSPCYSWLRAGGCTCQGLLANLLL